MMVSWGNTFPNHVINFACNKAPMLVQTSAQATDRSPDDNLSPITNKLRYFVGLDVHRGCSMFVLWSLTYNSYLIAEKPDIRVNI